MKHLVLASLICSASSAFAGLVVAEMPITTPRTINPQAIVAIGEDRLVFTDATFNQVGVITIRGTDMQVETLKLVDTVDATNLVKPQSIALAPDGTALFTGFITNSSGTPLGRSFFGRLTIDGGLRLQLGDLPTGNACRDLFGSPMCPVVVEEDGDAWVAYGESKKIAKITPANGVTEYTANFPGMYMVGIAVEADGTVAATDRVGGSVIRLDPVTGVATRIVIPRVGTQANGPSGIARLTDAKMLFADVVASYLGRLEPRPSMTVTKFDLGAGTQPNDVDAHPTAALAAFTLSGSKQIGLFDAAANKVVERVDVPRSVTPVDVDFTPSGKRMFVNGIDPATRDYVLFRVEGVEVPAMPNLIVAKAFVPAGVFGQSFTFQQPASRVGDELLLKIVVTNRGDTATQGEWTVRDDFSSCLELVDWPRNEASCKWDAATRTLTCRRSDALGAGASVEMVVRVRVTEAGMCTNTAVVSGGGDPSPGVSPTARVDVIDPRTVQFGLPPSSVLNSGGRGGRP